MIVRATYADCLHVARRMRQLDAEEILPMMHSPTPEQLAAHAAAASSAWCALGSNSEPIAIIGWTAGLPTVAQVFFFATDRWGEVAARTSAFARRFLKSQLADETRINRAECWSLERHETARAWLLWLGFKEFGRATDLGPNRETYYGYCFTRSMIEAESRKGGNHAKRRHAARSDDGAGDSVRRANGTGTGTAALRAGHS